MLLNISYTRKEQSTLPDSHSEILDCGKPDKVDNSACVSLASSRSDVIDGIWKPSVVSNLMRKVLPSLKYSTTLSGMFKVDGLSVLIWLTEPVISIITFIFIANILNNVYSCQAF